MTEVFNNTQDLQAIKRHHGEVREMAIKVLKSKSVGGDIDSYERALRDEISKLYKAMKSKMNFELKNKIEEEFESQCATSLRDRIGLCSSFAQFIEELTSVKKTFLDQYKHSGGIAE
jgi:hypothetical protein